MPFTPPGPNSYPSTFQPVLNQDFLNSLYSQINDQQAQDVGAAEGQAIGRGITNSPFEASAIGAANQTADTARNSALQGFLYNLAGMKEKENVLGEEQAFQTSERQGTEAWQGTENAAQLENQRGMNQASLDEQTKIQNMKDIYGLYSGAASAGIGALGALLI